MYCRFQSLFLDSNYIGKLANDSFALYPNIKKLWLSYNKVHTVEPGSLELLTELEFLDLSQNALKEVPPGLPKSLKKLYLNGNPVTDMRNLERAVGLQVLSLKGSELNAYPKLGVLPNLVELDLSENVGITDFHPVQLAGTCRLAKLNVTNTNVFLPDVRGSHCRCLRVIEWAKTYKITLYGLSSCPVAAAEDFNSGGDDDPENINCTRIPDVAGAMFKECMAEWEHRNTPYWAIGSGLIIVVAVLVALCVCLRRRRNRSRKRRTDKVHGGVATPTDTKENNDTAVAGNNKTEPAALLSSTWSQSVRQSVEIFTTYIIHNF